MSLKPDQAASRLPLALTLIGAVPFIVFATAIAFDWVENYEPLLALMLNYTAVIFSFLGGIHWGLAVANARESQHLAQLMMLESTLAALLAWGILGMDDNPTKLLAFAFLYAVIWGVDSVLYGYKVVPLWFLDLRGIVTPIVVVSMYVVYFSII